MAIEIIPVTGEDLVPGTFMSRWQCERTRPEEKDSIKACASLAKKGQVKIHALRINRRDYGFVSVNIHQLPKENPNKFYLLVDLLFVSKQYRGKPIDELEGMTASAYLMSIVYGKAIAAASFFPFDYIVLFPADPKLIPFFTSMGYASLIKSRAMFISLVQDHSHDVASALG